MKIRLANKIFDSCGTERECNQYKIDKANTAILRNFKNYKTPKWVLRKREQSKIKDKILTSNNILSEGLREYINNKQLKRKKHGRR